MSELQIINAAISGLSQAVSGINTTMLGATKMMVSAYENRTKELARRNDLAEKALMDGVPLYVVVQPAVNDATPADGIAQAAEDAATKGAQQPPGGQT
jgi:DNA repair photolyase